MASPSCNTHFDHLQMPDGYDWTIQDFNYSQFDHLVYQPSTSILAEPSIASADPLLCTDAIQYPFPSFALSSAKSSASPSTCSDLSRFNHNAIHHSPIDKDYAATAPATGYFGPRHDIACNNLPPHSLSVQRASQLKNTSNSYAKGKRASGRNQGRQQKQEKAQWSFQCHWKDCTYRDTFSGKPALMRHIDTQHVNPRSFYCPSCPMSFNRKDNMTEHRGRVHWERE
ncbi:hypothetical protein E8E15_010240 [Penicillium rubens]|uniref:Pc12g08150 protein n=1 Tax=Penicillium rubens (strain ATCC 28089 / DSM 1075 / NRRL 1951 / Wisconsin 54-1255) TaxID=500485 RepID=B6GXY5_PENRW|nr:uncharacterized protein N7525_001743 [Penicillium rubens]KAF3029006.1 hypothetical protein E8E15_010240 [Penicillium rubens]KAJ5844002.1 hypothetical protein N7525_001743 [Penicillium rubens]CAP80442.1 Pc12g08150 [Penicillium rubens Wisconsin 54-1255]